MLTSNYPDAQDYISTHIIICSFLSFERSFSISHFLFQKIVAGARYIILTEEVPFEFEDGI